MHGKLFFFFSKVSKFKFRFSSLLHSFQNMTSENKMNSYKTNICCKKQVVIRVKKRGCNLEQVQIIFKSCPQSEACLKKLCYCTV